MITTTQKLQQRYFDLCCKEHPDDDVPATRKVIQKKQREITKRRRTIHREVLIVEIYKEARKRELQSLRRQERRKCKCPKVV